MNRSVLTFLVLTVLPYPTNLLAQWQPDGVAVCTVPDGQYNLTAISDGAGGAIVVWQDGRKDISDIYAQRLSPAGVALWTAGGVAVCAYASNQCYPTVASDGAGGAIVSWNDLRSGPYNDIYVQRVNAAGVVQWTIDGVVISAAPDDQCYPTIVPDGFGGAIMTWHDYRGGTDFDIYAQRVDASGVPLWTTDGVALCALPNGQEYPIICSDGAHGAIATWFDGRNGSSDIYAQRVDPSGAVQWTANGVALCVSANTQYHPMIVADGAGGAIVAWNDRRTGTNYDIYAQQVNTTGVPQWTANGVPLCTAAGDQNNCMIASDGAGGAIVTWDDLRSGVKRDIYAQRVNGAGAVQWPANGAALCTASEDQSQAAIVADGSGGAVVAWRDLRSGSKYDIYAQRVDNLGAVQWPTDGVAVCAAVRDQVDPAIVLVGTGETIVAWQDLRNDVSGGYFQSDIYAQHVSSNGLTATGIHNTPQAPSVILTPNYPNPFSGDTALDLNLRNEADASVVVFDAAGRRVRAMELGHVAAGWRRLSFDGRDAAGRPLPSGVYFLRVTAAGETITRKLAIVR